MRKIIPSQSFLLGSPNGSSGVVLKHSRYRIPLWIDLAFLVHRNEVMGWDVPHSAILSDTNILELPIEGKGNILVQFQSLNRFPIFLGSFFRTKVKFFTVL